MDSEDADLGKKYYVIALLIPFFFSLFFFHFSFFSISFPFLPFAHSFILYMIEK